MSQERERRNIFDVPAVELLPDEVKRALAKRLPHIQLRGVHYTTETAYQQHFSKAKEVQTC